MARRAHTWALIIVLTVCIGCQEPNSGRGQIMPSHSGPTVTTASVVDISDTSEVDLVEKMAMSRQAYRQGLEMLEAYYTRVGNYEKLQWVRRELQSFDTMTKYTYITGPNRLPSSGQPIASIPEADVLYREAEQYEKKAGLLPLLVLPILKDENSLRLALLRYNQLIKNHPTSDKIDDAAYRAGVIYEYFKDYSIALLYFKSAIEWDPEGVYPARFRAARILDKYLYRKDEALQLYQQAVRIEGRYEKYREWREYAEKRISALQKLDEGQSQ